MSTRGAIAIGTVEEWHGVYQHSDSYPEPPHGLGPRLWKRIKEIGVDAAIAEIETHPGGWSFYPEVCHCHDEYFSKRDGSIAEDSPFYSTTAPDGRLNSKTADALTIPWVYVIDRETQELHVLHGRATGRLIILRDIYGKPFQSQEYAYEPIAHFDLNAREAHWEKVHYRTFVS